VPIFAETSSSIANFLKVDSYSGPFQLKERNHRTEKSTSSPPSGNFRYFSSLMKVAWLWVYFDHLHSHFSSHRRTLRHFKIFSYSALPELGTIQDASLSFSSRLAEVGLFPWPHKHRPPQNLALLHWAASSPSATGRTTKKVPLPDFFQQFLHPRSRFARIR